MALPPPAPPGAPALVLLADPLGAPQWWPALPGGLRGRGAWAAAAEVPGDPAPPYAARHIAGAALAIARLDPPGPLLLAAHGGAGPLLPRVGAAQRAAHRPLAGYLLVDSLLPQPGTPSRADLRRAQFGADAAAPGAAPVPDGYDTEPLPMAADWPDAPVGYLLSDPALAPCARLAALRGWPVLDRAGAPAPTAADLLDLAALL
ncbi:hypothetical protein LG943_10245 [Streptomonospora sp. S1-112]|uniref:Alpha/beta hydrolase n=1 Tax=Streptomonospora mangrovi TaxID=2883123 RepID=A0A9X3SH03_9ACTN|nr:hypothetical protein [Streptomonospora mangrovi]MDA0564704.1 hypothetical protein [Streptomonospora mangrovi]